MNGNLSEEAKHSIEGRIRGVGAYLSRVQGASRVKRVDQSGEYAKDPQVHTDADDFSEHEIVHAIKSVSDYPIITEQSYVQGESAEFVWIIDPIDGTAQYQHNLALYTISVALCSREAFAAEWGVVYAPALNLFYEASRGQGARCNDHEIRATAANPIEQMLVSVSAYRSFERVKKEEVFFKIISTLKQVRQFGCPSLDICFVADGRLDARVVAGYKAWDIAAATLIATESGATFANLETGEPANAYTAVGIVANGNTLDIIFRQVRERLQRT